MSALIDEVFITNIREGTRTVKITSGHEVINQSAICCTCAKRMPGCWDTVCADCGNTSCYEHSQAIDGYWFCQGCAQKETHGLECFRLRNPNPRPVTQKTALHYPLELAWADFVCGRLARCSGKTANCYEYSFQGEYRYRHLVGRWYFNIGKQADVPCIATAQK